MVQMCVPVDFRHFDFFLMNLSDWSMKHADASLSYVISCLLFFPN